MNIIGNNSTSFFSFDFSVGTNMALSLHVMKNHVAL